MQVWQSTARIVPCGPLRQHLQLLCDLIARLLQLTMSLRRPMRDDRIFRQRDIASRPRPEFGERVPAYWVREVQFVVDVLDEFAGSYLSAVVTSLAPGAI